MTQDLTDFDETGKIRLQSDLNENTKLNMILESEMERKQSGGEWWRVVAGGDSESCFLYLICLSVRKYFNLITTTYFVMQEVPNIYLCIHFQEKICNTFVLQFKVS